MQGGVGEGAAGESCVDVHVDGDRHTPDLFGKRGQVDGGAFDGVWSLGQLAEQARGSVGGGRLVVEDEVLVASDTAVVSGKEESEIGIRPRESEGDVDSVPGFFGHRVGRRRSCAPNRRHCRALRDTRRRKRMAKLLAGVPGGFEPALNCGLGFVAYGRWTRQSIESTPWRNTEDALRRKNCTMRRGISTTDSWP